MLVGPNQSEFFQLPKQHLAFTLLTSQMDSVHLVTSAQLLEVQIVDESTGLALDSVQQADAFWLSEAQRLREMRNAQAENKMLKVRDVALAVEVVLEASKYENDLSVV